MVDEQSRTGRGLRQPERAAADEASVHLVPVPEKRP